MREREHNVNKYSEQPINVISITNIFVHVSGDLHFNDENYDNHNSFEIDNNNIIFAMAVDKPFNSCLSYNNADAGNSFILGWIIAEQILIILN